MMRCLVNEFFLNVIKHVAVILLFFSLSGCIDHTVVIPEGYLSHEEMVPIMVDIHLVEGARSGKLVLGDTNHLPDYFARVYQKHEISEQQFKTSFDWYTKHPELLKAIYEDAIKQLSILDAEVKANAARPVRDSD